ncbi:MAG: DUF4395 domain-containing protein [Candidatus Brocadiales bacterium]|nr:DUF4395 domain-containing protein [Candidatus Brocadiales bacterium]MBL7007104.1 DUF4395 domain-containing protein [Spirochaetia bacterium]
MKKVKAVNSPPLRLQEAVVRGIAFQVFLVALCVLIWSSWYPIIFLIIDFFIRAIGASKYSLTAQISRTFLARLLRFKKRMILAKPKKFAAWIGLVMSVFAAAAVISGYISIMLIIIAVLALFSFLEAFLKFCAGCKIFGLLIKLGLLKEEVCLDCVLPGGDGI